MKTKQIANDILLPETARLITEGHTVTHIVRGNSMNPFLVDRRDKVTLSSFADADLKRGAFVLAIDSTGRFVLHRILCRNRKELILIGDGNVRETETSSTDQVMGIVTEVIRKGKTYSCNGFKWNAYSHTWLFLLPLRRVLLGAWRRIWLKQTIKE